MDVQAFIDSLPIIGKGLAGIYISVGFIMAMIWVMGKIGSTKKK